MTQSLVCPKCGEVFEPTDSFWENISKQVKDAEFEASVESKVELERVRSEAASKDDKARIAQLEFELKQQEEKFNLQLANAKSKFSSEMESSKLSVEKEYQQKLFDAENKIKSLESELSSADSKQELALVKADSEFKTQLAAKDNEIKMRDEEIRNMREMRSKLTVKLIGESLEQHCEAEFNKLRALAFKGATFGKDNEVKDGTKGDYIYKENMDDGTELLSIMFEMKNESDTSTYKKKNEDHFEKLHKDRTKKDCEYAILVSMLEPDNEFYNQGIVDVSHLYPKMYVIRPQFFIPMITLLRNAALNNVEAKQELTKQRLQNLDVVKFDEELKAFKEGFGMNFEHAAKKHMEAIEEIDKTIEHLQKVRKALTTSDTWLERAENKLNGLTVKKLTAGNPTMKEKFAEANLIE